MKKYWISSALVVISIGGMWFFEDGEAGLSKAQLIFLAILAIVLWAIGFNIFLEFKADLELQKDFNELVQLLNLSIRTPEQEAGLQDLFAKFAITSDAEAINDMSIDEFNKLFNE